MARRRCQLWSDALCLPLRVYKTCRLDHPDVPWGIWRCRLTSMQGVSEPGLRPSPHPLARSLVVRSRDWRGPIHHLASTCTSVVYCLDWKDTSGRLVGCVAWIIPCPSPAYERTRSGKRSSSSRTSGLAVCAASIRHERATPGACTQRGAECRCDEGASGEAPSSIA